MEGAVRTLTFTPRMGEASLRSVEARRKRPDTLPGTSGSWTDADCRAGPAGETEREIVRERQRDTERQRDETDRDTQRREAEIDREMRDTERDRETEMTEAERQRDRDRERQTEERDR